MRTYYRYHRRKGTGKQLATKLILLKRERKSITIHDQKRRKKKVVLVYTRTSRHGIILYSHVHLETTSPFYNLYTIKRLV